MALEQVARAECPIETVALVNANGCRACLSTLGASLLSLEVPDRDGQPVNVVLGYGRPEDYLCDQWFVGCVAGRYAGRIAQGVLQLDGKRWQLPRNDGNHHLHGGSDGFHKRLWSMEQSAANAVVFSYISTDGEQGYPGELDVQVIYVLDDHNALHISYRATTTAATVINLTNHSYFNLAGRQADDILNHELHIASDEFALLDADLIPTGELAPVASTAMDFRKPVTIGARIKDSCAQMRLTGGYDHAWILAGTEAGKASVTLSCQASGISMALHTDQTTVQFYSGNSLPARWPGEDAVPCGRHRGLCLETQHLPNSPNTPAFPSTVLRPGESYCSSTVYRFFSDGKVGQMHNSSRDFDRG